MQTDVIRIFLGAIREVCWKLDPEKKHKIISMFKFEP